MRPDTTTQPETTTRLLSPVGALVAVVALAFVVLAAVSWFVVTPRIFHDELIYMEAAASLADGEGLEVRGEPYRYGALYPTVAAPVGCARRGSRGGPRAPEARSTRSSSR